MQNHVLWKKTEFQRQTHYTSLLFTLIWGRAAGSFSSTLAEAQKRRRSLPRSWNHKFLHQPFIGCLSLGLGSHKQEVVSRGVKGAGWFLTDQTLDVPVGALHRSVVHKGKVNVCVCVCRSAGTAAAVQSGRCPASPWTVPSSTSCPGSADSSPGPPTSDSCWSSSDWLLDPGEAAPPSSPPATLVLITAPAPSSSRPLSVSSSNQLLSS